MPAHPRLRRSLAATAVLPLTFAFAACGSDDDGDAPDADPTVTVTQTPDSGTTDSTDDGADGGTGGSGSDEGRVGPTGALVAAAATALDAVKGATVTSVDDDPQGWEVSLVGADGEQEVVVNGDGSQVVAGPRPDDDVDPGDAAEEQSQADAAKIDYAAAVDAATGSATGEVIGVDLGDDAGRTVWTVDLRDGTTEQEVTVDAVTGEVVGTETDD